MKVALFVHCFFPAHFYGTETYTLHLAQRLRESGVDVLVVTAVFPNESRQPAFVHRYEVDGIPVVSLDKNDVPDTRIKDTYYQDGMRAPLTELLERERPDLIHVTHLINHTAVLLEVAHALGIPCVATFTDFFGFCFNNKLEGADGELCAGPSPSRRNCMACYLKAVAGQPAVAKPLQWAAKAGANRWGALVLDKTRKLDAYRHGEIDGLVEDLRQRPDILAACYTHYRAAIAPTRFLESAYRRNGFDRPITRSWFGVDFDRSAKRPRDRSKPIVFGFIGQLAPHKGTDLLIQAFARLPAGRAELHVYGPPDQDPVFMRRLESLATGHAVRFLGTFEQHRTREILDTMDLLAIPSRWYENSPLVLLNALASHTPVLVSDVEGLTEFIEPGVNGFAFRRGSVSSIAACLRRFVDEPGLATRMSRDTAYVRDTRAMADDVLALYRQIPLASKRAGANAGPRAVGPDAAMESGDARGCRMPLAEWTHMNRVRLFQDASLIPHVGPFPPVHLMKNVSGLQTQEDFASHGADFFEAISAASPKPLPGYRSILDFGCGCGRLGRMFKGHPGRVAACDIDRRHVDWVDKTLDFVEVRLSAVEPPLPYGDDEFECVISISIFTHLDETSQDEFLGELARITAPDGLLFVTVHGERAMQRVRDETGIRDMLDVPVPDLRTAQFAIENDRHAFIRQNGHLTTTAGAAVGTPRLVDGLFDYGITFVSQHYVRSHWSRWFDVVDYRSGALHDFQDLVVLKVRRDAKEVHLGH